MHKNIVGNNIIRDNIHDNIIHIRSIHVTLFVILSQCEKIKFFLGYFLSHKVLDSLILIQSFRLHYYGAIVPTVTKFIMLESS
jgi:hypothetical protein